MKLQQLQEARYYQPPSTNDVYEIYNKFIGDWKRQNPGRGYALGRTQDVYPMRALHSDDRDVAFMLIGVDGEPTQNDAVNASTNFLQQHKLPYDKVRIDVHFHNSNNWEALALFGEEYR